MGQKSQMLLCALCEPQPCQRHPSSHLERPVMVQLIGVSIVSVPTESSAAALCGSALIYPSGAVTIAKRLSLSNLSVGTSDHVLKAFQTCHEEHEEGDSDDYLSVTTCQCRLISYK